MFKGCKGAQRRMIMLKNTGSELFDAAYFIISENAGAAAASEDDMVAEANRIVSKNMLCVSPDERAGGAQQPEGWLRRLLWAGSGMIAGGGAVLLAQLML